MLLFQFNSVVNYNDQNLFYFIDCGIQLLEDEIFNRVYIGQEVLGL